MGDLLGVTVEELVRLLKQRGARLPFEIGAFVALEVCEQLVEGPAVAKPSEVRIATDGSISVYAPPNSASAEQAARSVVDVLAHLLVAAGQGVPPVLLELVEQGPADGRWELGRLRDELEASLVPLNRAAARRVLSRMLREIQREPTGAQPTGAAGTSQDGDVDADLDALIGEVDGAGSGASAEITEEVDLPETEELGQSEGFPSEEHTLPQKAPAGDRASGGAASGGTWRYGEAPPLDEAPPAAGPSGRPTGPPSVQSDPPPPAGPPSSQPPPAGPPSSQPPPPSPHRGEPEPAPSPQAEPAEAARPVRAPLDLESLEEEAAGKQGKGGRGLWWLLGFVALIGALVVGVAVFRPDAVDRFMGREAPEDVAADKRAEQRRAEQEQLLEEHRGKYGDLTVTTAERAQVLLFVGRGPAEAHDLPVGVAHEFVAIADGRAPTRAVVPKDAQWSQGEQGAHYELAMQTGDEKMAFDELELGETKLPREVGAPGAKLGTVRVVTTPPGAKVYLLIGFGPTVDVQDVRTDEAHELLVYLGGHDAERVVVGPSDWSGPPDARVATVDVPFPEGDEG